MSATVPACTTPSCPSAGHPVEVSGGIDVSAGVVCGGCGTVLAGDPGVAVFDQAAEEELQAQIAEAEQAAADRVAARLRQIAEMGLGPQ